MHTIGMHGDHDTGRQARLSRLFAGYTESLSLTVFACYTYKPSLAEFEEICAKHDLNPNEDMLHIFEKSKPGEDLFHDCFLMKNGDSIVAKIPDVQPVFTQTGYVMASGKDSMETSKRQVDDTKAIADHYKSALVKQHGKFTFNDALDGVSENDGEISFRSMIHGFNMDICHPSNEGKLLPLTVIPNVTVTPAVAQPTILLPTRRR